MAESWLLIFQEQYTNFRKSSVNNIFIISYKSLIFPIHQDPIITFTITATMNNLQIFRTSTTSFLSASEIPSLDIYHALLEHLCDLKIFSPQEVKILNHNVQKRSFPITIHQFEQIIMKQFGDEGTRLLKKDIEHIQRQIRQTKGVLSVWKEQGLSKSEITALEVLFARGNSKMKQICTILEEKKNLLESISEPEIQIIKAMDEWTIVQKVRKQYEDYQQYLKVNQKSIESLYNQLRVREVHFRNKKIIKNQQQTIHVALGFNSKTDQPVQVTKIPKKMTDFDKVNTALVTFNAQRDLFLSAYFVRFLGYSTNADPAYYYYFRENIQTKNLHSLLQKSPIELTQQHILFRYWAGEIFRGFTDIYYKCSYEPVLPVTLHDIEIADYGLKVVFKHVRFDRQRQKEGNIEAELLENVGRLIMELLGIAEGQIDSKVKSLQNRYLLYTLIKARQGRSNYQKKIVPCFINFHNAQTHRLFQTVQEAQAAEIIDCFTMMFSDQII